MTLEEKLETLKKYGIELYPHITVDDLRFMYECSDDTSYEDLIYKLGENNLSGDLWWGDADIEILDDFYVGIAQKYQEITDGILPLTDIQGSINWDNGISNLSFALHGQQHEWNFHFDHDFGIVFDRLDQLITEQKTDKKIVVLIVRDLESVQIFASDEQVKQLRAEIGVEDF